MMNYYGQHGEDAIISILFQKDYKGFFVEVGALDGVRFSNTYMFEKMGWDGIVIEAHPDYFNILKKNRKCDCIWVAVGDLNKEKCTFYANFRGSLSTLDKKADFSGYGKYWGKHEKKIIDGFTNGEITVPMSKLDTILKNRKSRVPIDIISIDIDGSETLALKGFDIRLWRPRVIIFEVSTVPDVIYNYMSDKGYHLSKHIGCNVIYCRDLEDCKKIKNSSINMPASNILHPIDANRDKVEIV